MRALTILITQRYQKLISVLDYNMDLLGNKVFLKILVVRMSKREFLYISKLLLLSSRSILHHRR